MDKEDLKNPPMALLIVGIIFSPTVELKDIAGQLESVFGNIMVDAGPVPFKWTRYYEREMGPGLKRYFVAFDTLLGQEQLLCVKLRTMEMETMWMNNGNRRVNIDPGILSAERLVLATRKNFTHRIYLGKGIFADLTLIYHKGRFSFLDWTYPDYRSQIAIEFLVRARKKYLGILKQQRG